jgi:hypothetical protein
MSRKLVLSLVTMLCLLLVGFTSTALAMEKDENPIDKAFLKDRNEAMNTVEINYVVEKYAAAWKSEMYHVGASIKGKYQFAEDKARIDDYIEAYEKVADAAIYVEWLNWSDTGQEPMGRRFGTGAAGASVSAKATIYKQATLNLIIAYQGQEGNHPDNSFKYDYLYSGNGAELEKMKENRNKSLLPTN